MNTHQSEVKEYCVNYTNRYESRIVVPLVNGIISSRRLVT